MILLDGYEGLPDARPYFLETPHNLGLSARVLAKNPRRGSAGLARDIWHRLSPIIMDELLRDQGGRDFQRRIGVVTLLDRYVT